MGEVLKKEKVEFREAPRQYMADQLVAEMSKTNQPSQIEGVGKDAPIETNEKGGKQSYIPYAFHLIDPKAILALAKVLAEGERKYGRDNWRKISTESHLNHALTHIYAHLGGDTQDEHLEHAFCRLMMALGVIYQEGGRGWEAEKPWET